MSLLKDLPNRGNLTNIVPGRTIMSTVPPRKYLPQSKGKSTQKEQIVVTDPTNILIRSLSLSRRSESESHRQDVIRGKGKGKAAAAPDKDKLKRRGDEKRQNPAQKRPKHIPTSSTPRETASGSRSSGDMEIDQPSISRH